MSDPNPRHIGIMIVLFISTTLIYGVRQLLRSGMRKDRDGESEHGVIVVRRGEEEYVMPYDVVYEGFGLESGLFR
jgi:hypothetical protein